MQNPHHPLRKRQSDVAPSAPSISGVVGGATATSVGVGSSLLLGPSATSTPLVSNPLDPNDPVITITEPSSSSPTTSSSSSSPASHTNPPVSTGAVLGISAAVFVVAVAVMFAVYTHYKKRTYERTRRPPRRGPPPTPRVEEGTRGRSGDKWERLEGDKPPVGVVHPPAPPKTPEIGKLFEKDPSVRSVSDEKASHTTFDPATMPNFVKYHPDDLSTVPPPRPFATGAESSQVVSWGGDTVAGSFLSFRTSGSMSPSAAIRQTPITTDSVLHRWESAEVLNMDEPERPSVYSETEVVQDPFRDEASRSDGSEADTRAAGSNPFFNASQHNPFSDRSSRSRKSSISTVKRSRSRSRSNSVASRGTVRAGVDDNALLSLIAALDSNPVPSEDPSIRASIQTTTSSVYTQGSMVPPTPKAF